MKEPAAGDAWSNAKPSDNAGAGGGWGVDPVATTSNDQVETKNNAWGASSGNDGGAWNTGSNTGGAWGSSAMNVDDSADQGRG